jgi:FAD/FMN-containing dehydrogenase
VSFCYVTLDLRTYDVLPTSVITVDAGVQWYEAYTAAQAHGRTVVGGSGGTVGAAGGWVMGGGHSALSPRHGLGTFHHFFLDIPLFNS